MDMNSSENLRSHMSLSCRFLQVTLFILLCVCVKVGVLLRGRNFVFHIKLLGPEREEFNSTMEKVQNNSLNSFT
jgi:hypothetical protein